jgi:endonuclease/exonuclease/phosphatase (EEP) superfamily protein YafD
LKRLGLALCLLQTALYVVGLGAAYVPAAQWWWPAVVTLAFPWLLAIQVLLAVAVTPLRRVWPLWVVLLGVGLLRLPAYITWHPARSGPLKVMSMNANYFGALDAGSVRENVLQAQSVLRKFQPDILCGQDYTTDSEVNNTLIHEFLGSELRLQHRTYATPSLWTYSHEPISAYRGASFPESDNSFCYSDTILGGRPVRVFNVHLQSYQFGSALPGPRRSLPRRVLRRLRTGLQMRSEQADLVAAFVQESPHPVILCGDFNDVPSSYVFRRLSAGLRDGFRRAGKGVAVTYKGPLPGLRIDYILCSPELEFTRYEHVDGPAFTDHRWVYAELRWRS